MRYSIFLSKSQMLMWLIETCVCVTYLAHMYSNSVIVVFVVNVMYVRMSVDEMTVNDDALLFFSCPLLSSCYDLVHWSCACVWRERSRAQVESSEQAKEKWGASNHAQETRRENKKDRTSQGWRERKKKCIIIKRTIIWRFTVGRRSSVGWWWWWRSLLCLPPRIAFRARSLLRSMQHLVCPVTQRYLLFFPTLLSFSLFFSFFPL
jgi:hypothetical protein